MHNHLYVIIILAFIGKEITTTESCGTLSSSPVEEGQNATLEFIPHKKYTKPRREWLHNPRRNKHVLLFDSANTTFKSDKYFEVPKDKGYLLIIQKTTFENAEGIYAVRCQGNIYSNIVRLDVLNVTPTTIHVPNTQRSSTDEGRKVSITSKQPSTTPVNSVIYDEKEVKPTTSIHVTYTHGSSNDEGKDISITTLQPSTTAVISIIATEQEVKTYQNKDDEEPIKEIPNQSTTTKGKTSASTEKEKGINTEDLKLLIPLSCSVVGIVVAVAVGTVCVTVRKKSRNKETQLKTPEMESDDKEGSKSDGRFAEDVRNPGGVQEQAHPSSSDVRSDVAQASEPPEYACVIPREKRACESKQNINKTAHSLICDNKETENQLVYAELDLQPVSSNRPSKYEATEYVTIDFSKTGTSQADTGLPDKNETTEYVSVDFSKTGTSETDTGLPKQNETTEYVSVNFSKTGTSQAETGLAEQQDTTEHVMVDLSNKAELQTEHQGAAI